MFRVLDADSLCMARDSQGDFVLTCVFRDPVPTSLGKGPRCCHSAALVFLDVSRELGYDGICIVHTCFERALQAQPSTASEVVRVVAQREVLRRHCGSG